MLSRIIFSISRDTSFLNTTWGGEAVAALFEIYWLVSLHIMLPETQTNREEISSDYNIHILRFNTRSFTISQVFHNLIQ